MSATNFSNRMHKLGQTIAALDSDTFWHNLCEFLISECAFDDIAVFLYVDSQTPVRLYDRAPTPERDRLHTDLLAAAYLIGPYYNNVVSKQAPSGFYTLSAIAPDAFRESEYFRMYFQEKGTIDEGMFFACVEPGRSIGILCERKSPANELAEGELKRLEEVSPVITALIGRQVRDEWVATRQTEMATIIECFGRDFLSKREKEIAELILKGHSSKSGARELGISPETERVHRKRLYQRLNLSSQSELFWLFIQSVRHFDPAQNNDPLCDMYGAPTV